jgi:hypothetical protein
VVVYFNHIRGDSKAGSLEIIMERKIDWARLYLAFFIACFLFTFGLFIGYLAKGIVEEISLSIEETTRNELTNLETLSLLEKKFPCNSEVLGLTSQKLDYLGGLIDTLETKKGKDDPQVLELKKLYTILEVRHMLLVLDREEQCSSQKSDVFLFFYSNGQECKEDVDRTSFILSYLRKKYSSSKVYSFDADLQSELIAVLKNEYSTSGCASVVLNGKNVGFTIQKAEQLETLMKA